MAYCASLVCVDQPKKKKTNPINQRLYWLTGNKRGWMVAHTSSYELPPQIWLRRRVTMWLTERFRYREMWLRRFSGRSVRVLRKHSSVWLSASLWCQRGSAQVRDTSARLHSVFWGVFLPLLFWNLFFFLPQIFFLFNSLFFLFYVSVFFSFSYPKPPFFLLCFCRCYQHFIITQLPAWFAYILHFFLFDLTSYLYIVPLMPPNCTAFTLSFSLWNLKLLCGPLIAPWGQFFWIWISSSLSLFYIFLPVAFFSFKCFICHHSPSSYLRCLLSSRLRLSFLFNISFPSFLHSRLSFSFLPFGFCLLPPLLPPSSFFRLLIPPPCEGQTPAGGDVYLHSQEVSQQLQPPPPNRPQIWTRARPDGRRPYRAKPPPVILLR